MVRRVGYFVTYDPCTMCVAVDGLYRNIDGEVDKLDAVVMVNEPARTMGILVATSGWDDGLISPLVRCSMRQRPRMNHKFDNLTYEELMGRTTLPIQTYSKHPLPIPKINGWRFKTSRGLGKWLDFFTVLPA